MGIEGCFRVKKFDPRVIAGELYNPDKIGGISIEGFLEEDFRLRLLEEIKQGHWIKAKREYKKAVQDFHYFNLGEEDENPQSGFPLVNLMKELYNQLYKALAREASFQTGGINSISVQKYLKGSLGITPHRDEARYKNLVSNFILEGEGDFCICEDREKSNSIRLVSGPGSLILMRAPRNSGEQDLRPMHYVDRVERERYIIGLRDKAIN